ncbi:F0F1 ATP synthase subunit B [Alicyclobacillus tolerans]|uniref:ATP synthase subunit b n=2 Tax=Alicyclobacillus tolerans TaxID=90970 RepID=A0ABT9LU86_9BACL|nr:MULTISPECIES: F0F1 ATP synthase subunit B [Alicyclobacillus]MDP9727761.1 F-type H+-transporting ATPase subunit b [Alicyclobacillus tengchongensis]QRF24443.1 F0F1 ATP synthase subunit B [Alicyclobacillus sp. TC]SHK54231.1 ATP synthase F0 subcomplex B subunit [Alicyclobacillus montanus]
MFELGTFIVSIISFLIVFWIISKVGFKPLANVMEQRRVYVTSQLEDAEKNRHEAERLLEEQRKLLEQTRQEAKNILDAARQRADEQARQMLKEAQEEAARILAEGRELIERERAEAMNQAMQRMTELSVQLTSKLLHSYANEQVHAEMIKEAEQKLGELVC